MGKPNLNNFGKKLKFSKRPSKKKTFDEKELFIEIVDSFFDIWKRSNSTYEQYKINLLEYEEKFYQVIEGLINIKYGPWKTELILWYIFAREDLNTGKISPLVLQVDGKEDVEVTINNPKDLWELLKKLEEDENINNK